MNSYVWRGFSCEICKQEYQEYYRAKNGMMVSVLNYKLHNDAENYMILESVAKENKTIHVCSFDLTSRLYVGRAQTADIRILDSSVSRHHAYFQLCHDGTLTLID